MSLQRYKSWRQGSKALFAAAAKGKTLGRWMTNSIMRNTMKKTYLMILAAGLVCLAACQKEDFSIDDMENAAITYIRANEESSTTTKASIDNTTAAFTWNTNDRVAVYADGYKISDPLADTYNGTNAATFAFSGANAVTEAERANFAIFPASLVWDGTSIRTGSASNYTSSGLTVTLPASYTLAEVQNDVSPCPMIATNAPNGDLSFKHLCALLRVEVSNVPATTRRLVFVFNDKKVQGEFTLTGVEPGTSSIETAAASGSNNTITVFTPDIDAVSTLTINLPLPTGTYDYITISAYDKAEGGLPIYTNTRLIKKSSPGTWTSNRLSSRKISAALSQITFSVSSTKKVIFSPGNLQATTTDLGANWTWDFAEHQYDYIGNTTHNPNSINHKMTSTPGVVTANGTLDLFYRSVTGNGYGIITTSESISPYYGADFVDWGTLVIGSYTANYWHSLTKNEWCYLTGFNISGSVRNPVATVNGVANARCTKAVVNSVKGFIIFPDRYEGPTATVGTDIVWGAGINSSGTSGWNTTVTLAGWATLEAAGCVFLPAAGRRSGSTLYSIGDMGQYKQATYWSRLRFNDSGYAPQDSNGDAGSVRLAHDVN